MRKSIKSLTLPALGMLAIGLMVPSMAVAEVEITPLVGYRAGGFDLSTGIVCVQPPCPSAASSEDDALLGLVVDLPLRDRWQFEVLLNRQATRLSYRDGVGGPKVLVPGADLDVTHLHAGLLRSWELSKVEPFAVLGAGLTRLQSDPLVIGGPLTIGEVDADRFSASLGAGARFGLSKRVALRLETRGYWVDMPKNLGAPFLDRFGDDLVQVETSAGVSFRL